MKTWQAGTRKALRSWSELLAEQQQELLTKCNPVSVIQLDTQSKTWSIVSVLFGMDLYIHSQYLYLFPDDIQK